MWDYTKEVWDHFQNPRNVGRIENPSGDGLAGSLACGDALRLTFLVDENEVITDAKFQTFGCASAIAAASVLTEIIIGMTITEAEKVTNKDIVNVLSSLPKQKVHCSVMGKEALAAAIYNYRTGKTLNVTVGEHDHEHEHDFGVRDNDDALKNEPVVEKAAKKQCCNVFT